MMEIKLGLAVLAVLCAFVAAPVVRAPHQEPPSQRPRADHNARIR